MDRAGKRIWGQAFSMASIDFAGSLDPVILAQATDQAGFGISPGQQRQFRHLYSEELRIELALPSARSYALPGVLALLTHLRTAQVATLGLLTGNYEETACQKLAAVGIDPGWFSPRVWGDDGATRPELVRVAMQRQNHTEPRSVFVIGDTTRDVHCAKVNGCRVVGVATGMCSKQELMDAGADLVFENLMDHGPLLALLEST